MIKTRRSLSTPIRPMVLEQTARNTAPNLAGCGCDQLAGFDFQAIIDNGTKFVRDQMLKAQSGDGNAHIAAQNRAGADMNTVVTSYNQIKSQGLLTLTTIDQAEDALQQITANFSNFAKQVGTARAYQGARDIQGYADAAIRDMERDRAPLGGTPSQSGGMLDVPSGVTLRPTGLTPYVQTASTYLPYVLAAVFLFMVSGAARRKG